MFCNQCGAKHETIVKFCSKCGSPMEVTNNPETETQPAYSAPQQPQELQPAYSAPLQQQVIQPAYGVIQPQEPQPAYSAPLQQQVIQPAYGVIQPQEPQPAYSAPQQPQVIQSVNSDPQPPVAPPAYDAAPSQQPNNRKKSGMPKFVIPAAAAVVVLVSTCAALFLFTDIIKGNTNGKEEKPAVIEEVSLTIEPTETPNPAETPVPIVTIAPAPVETIAPAPIETPDDQTGNTGSGTIQAPYYGAASDYATMPGSYGKSRNVYGYTINDTKGVTYDNFMKLEIGMSLSDVRSLFPDADTASSEYTYYTEWTFRSNVTTIYVAVDDGKVKEASYYDSYRICVDSADVLISEFMRLEVGMTFDEVIDLMGGDFFVCSISSYSNLDATRLTWFNDGGEITVVFDSSNKVSAFMEAGFQQCPDMRFDYYVLTNQQLLENFQKIRTGIDYFELMSLMECYIPLFEASVNMNFAGTLARYEFTRSDGDDNQISIKFRFEDAKLVNADIYTIPDSLLTMTDSASAQQIRERMSYSEVIGILGESYCVEVDARYGKVWECYKWDLPGYFNYIRVQFTDGIVDYIYLNDD